MSDISRPIKSASGTGSYQANSTIKSSELNSDFDTIYNDYTGNIDNTNIATSAAIVASKLDLSTISQNIDITGILTADSLNCTGTFTCDTVTADNIQVDFLTTFSTDAVTPLTTDRVFFLDADDSNRTRQATIQSVLDLSAGAVSVYSGNFTRVANAGNGTQAITGVGFQPKAVIFFMATGGNTMRSYGIDDGTTAGCTYRRQVGDSSFNTTYSIYFDSNTGVTEYRANITALGSDGFTLTWVTTGSPAATSMTIPFLAIG